jgi:hypothetical protein
LPVVPVSRSIGRYGAIPAALSSRTMASMAPTPDLAKRLRAVAAFQAELEDPAFTSGRWHDSERQGDAMTMPWFELSPRALAFVAALGGLLMPGFAWPEWAKTDEAQALARDRDVLARASADDLGRLATALIRQDRFIEGALSEAFDTGLMAALARRAGELAGEMGDAEVGVAN